MVLPYISLCQLLTRYVSPFVLSFVLVFGAPINSSLHSGSIHERPSGEHALRAREIMEFAFFNRPADLNRVIQTSLRRR